MDINFADKKLEKYANDDKLMAKKLGNLRAKKYKQRLNDLRNAITLEDIRHAPGKYHELKEDRKGEWACSLDDPYRLIFEPQEDPIPEYLRRAASAPACVCARSGRERIFCRWRHNKTNRQGCH